MPFDAQQLRVCIEEAPVPYLDMLDRQRETRAAVQRGGAPHTLFLLEHPPVITCGRQTDAANLLRSPEWLHANNIELAETDRGGDVTYHGPGQLVAYPILNLSTLRPSVGWYLRRLEEVLINLLSDYAIEGGRVEGLTGVWTRDAKIAAIGIGVREWVTFHGCALNIDPDLTHFSHIVPCGIAHKPVTSMREQLGDAPPLPEVRGRFVEHFARVFELEAMP